MTGGVCVGRLASHSGGMMDVSPVNTGHENIDSIKRVRERGTGCCYRGRDGLLLPWEELVVARPDAATVGGTLSWGYYRRRETWALVLLEVYENNIAHSCQKVKLNTHESTRTHVNYCRDESTIILHYTSKLDLGNTVRGVKSSATTRGQDFSRNPRPEARVPCRSVGDRPGILVIPRIGSLKILHISRISCQDDLPGGPLRRRQPWRPSRTRTADNTTKLRAGATWPQERDTPRL